jgi:uncharacterized protein YxeA
MEVFMKNKKLKIILAIISVIVIMLLAIIIRNIIILNSLNNKNREYANIQNDNMKLEINSTSESYKSRNMQLYKKDGISKYVIKTEKEDGTILNDVQLTYPDERRNYTDKGGIKILNIYSGDNTNVTEDNILNYADSDNFLEKIKNSIVTKITSEICDGKDCYKLEGKLNSNFLCDENTKKEYVYIDKETGLTVKVIDIKENENGEKQEYSASYSYDFGNVTDEDMEEPDATGYEIIKEIAQ